MFLAPLNYNRFFQKVFSDEKIAKKFLEDFLEVEIESFEFLKEKHKITDDSQIVEFDFRCKIHGNYVIIDMQQWYKPDITQRFYVYHAIGTGLQLEKLPTKGIMESEKPKRVREIKDYRKIQPVLTLIWMVDDTLRFEEDYVGFTMTPETALEFIKNHELWRKKAIEDLVKEREKALKIIENDTRDLDFLPKNRLIFMFQKNIVKNRRVAKYEKWFEFAEKTRDENNREEDFNEYSHDKLFSEMIRRLRQEELSEDDIKYIKSEKSIWEKVTLYEKGNFDLGKKEGIKEGEKKGIKKGIKEGEKKGIKEEKVKIAKKMLLKGVAKDDIEAFTGLSKTEINTL